MKNILTPALRAATLTAALSSLPLFVSASPNPTPADSAAQALVIAGTVPVKAAGPYVEIGTYQIQVSVKLGRPTFRLPDGSWLYGNFSVPDSHAAGFLLVRFNQGRVSELALVSPAVATALLDAPKNAHERILTAAQDRR
jgi:hypothetical protein